MEDKKESHWTHGSLERICVGLPPVEVDCSAWEADIPEEAWSHGQFDVPVRHLPVVEVDCSGWDAGPPAWLELVIAFSDTAKPAQVMDQAKRLIGLVAAGEPDLRLAYDPRLSRTEGEEVVVALVPQAGSATEGRLEAFAVSMGKKLLADPVGPRAAVRVGRAA